MRKNIIKLLGFGSNGQVFEIEDPSSKEHYAMKVIQKTEKKSVDVLMQEAMILGQLDHPNIVKLIKVEEDCQNIYLILELVKVRASKKDGTLLDLIRQRSQQEAYLSERQIALLMRHILAAVEHMHSRNIIHRDLKPRKIPAAY